MLDRAARKIGLVLAAVTFIPWVLIVIGFALFFININLAPTGTFTFPFWIISVGGLPLIALACVHAAVITPGAVKILRVVITFMSVIFLLSLGMLFYISGNFIVSSIEAGLPARHSINLLFAGSLLATIVWTGQMVLWTFYEEPLRSTHHAVAI